MLSGAKASRATQARRCAVWRGLWIVMIALVVVGVSAPAVGATPAKKLEPELGALWTKVLQTPSAQNSFGVAARVRVLAP